MASEYRFSFGPWNISEGQDPFGPTVREAMAFDEKLGHFRELGFEGIMLHDDDAVPNLPELSAQQIEQQAGALKQRLDDLGLVPEIVAPRLWEAPEYVDGAYTANDPKVREQAIERSKRCIDVANVLGTDLVVLWLAREGTYQRESKNAREAYQQILDAINQMLDYDANIRIAIEPKPNEPMDQAYVPTIGHAVALAYRSDDPARVGALVESAHAILAGLDAADEMAFALAADKLWSVHLNDQNGLKYDQDKTFGSANLRGAFDQVRVLEEYGYGRHGEMVAFDVKPMRTTRPEDQLKHLKHSREIFLMLVDKVRSVDRDREQELIAARDYESLERYLVAHLLGVA